MLANKHMVRVQSLLAAGATGSWSYERLKLTIISISAFALEVGGMLAVIAIAYYGIRMALARGDQAAFGKAKEGLTLSLIGVALIFGAYTIIYTIRAATESLAQ